MNSLKEIWSTKSTICCVGNGPSILNIEAGEKIQSFDCVVRFNNFKVQGFEKYVGEKTDVWVTRIDDTIRYRGENFKKSYGIINHCKRTPFMQSWIPDFKNKYPNMEIVDVDKIKVYSDRFGFGPPHNSFRLTVGFLTILMLTEAGFRDITICGFGGQLGTHYYGGETKGHEKHKFDIESKYISALVERGILKCL